MKYFLRKTIPFVFICVFNIIPVFTFSDDIIVNIPDWWWQENINVDNPQVQTNESTIFEYIQIINYYLWFSIAWIAMAVLIYAWLQMITAWWDKWKVWKAWKLALSCLIAIIIAMLSYLLVNLIIKIF